MLGTSNLDKKVILKLMFNGLTHLWQSSCRSDQSRFASPRLLILSLWSVFLLSCDDPISIDGQLSANITRDSQRLHFEFLPLAEFALARWKLRAFDEASIFGISFEMARQYGFRPLMALKDHHDEDVRITSYIMLAMRSEGFDKTREHDSLAFDKLVSHFKAALDHEVSPRNRFFLASLLPSNASEETKKKSPPACPVFHSGVTIRQWKSHTEHPESAFTTNRLKGFSDLLRLMFMVLLLSLIFNIFLLSSAE